MIFGPCRRSWINCHSETAREGASMMAGVNSGLPVLGCDLCSKASGPASSLVVDIVIFHQGLRAKLQKSPAAPARSLLRFYELGWSRPTSLSDCFSASEFPLN